MLVLSKDVKELLEIIAVADIVKVNDDRPSSYTLGWERDINLDTFGILENVEDFFIIFTVPSIEEEYMFSWWEIREDSKKLNDTEWKIGDKIVSFYTLSSIKS